MDYYLERLENELKKIAIFWSQHLISNEDASIYPECSTNGTPDKSGDLGSLYLSRLLYGSSAICNFLNTTDYKVLADLSFKVLYERFRNPAGGFYWAKNQQNEIIHDSDNINMAQAFVLYGLTEYAQLTHNPIVEAEIKKLLIFIHKTIYDHKHGGYLDGFSDDWKQEKNFTKSLGTHLHFMEAYVKYYQLSGDTQLLPQIASLIDLIYNKFIDKNTFECYHSFTPDWNKLPNFNWAGHNAEVSWLLCWATQTIKNKDLADYACNISKKITEKLIEQAFDKNYGGVFNEIKDGTPTENEKIWWPQTEAALCCMNAYICTKEKVFLSYGLRLIEYIENTFSDDAHGEWYNSVTREGMPIDSKPKVYLWKSMYHNVRYCIEMSKMIKILLK